VNLVRFAHPPKAENNGTMEYWDHWCSIIGRLIGHIPDKYFPMIRYAGLFSNRWKKQYLAQARTALSLPESDDCSENTKPLWAERQSDYTGINPLQCPNCDKPLTFVGCFFGNWNQLQHLFEKFHDSNIPSFQVGDINPMSLKTT
jgi:hypothetical protein